VRNTRGAQCREVKVVPLGVSVFKGCEKMLVRSASRFSWSLTAQLRSSCLGVIDLQPVQAVDYRSLSIVYDKTAFCAVARPVCHCWCDSSRTATKRLQLYLVVIVHVLQVSSAFCITSTSRYSLAPNFLRQSTSCATPTISPLWFC
jgi:hypothetical protein